jgi:hypothetical protein
MLQKSINPVLFFFSRNRYKYLVNTGRLPYPEESYKESYLAWRDDLLAEYQACCGVEVRLRPGMSNTYSLDFLTQDVTAKSLTDLVRVTETFAGDSMWIGFKLKEGGLLSDVEEAEPYIKEVWPEFFWCETREAA